MAEAEYSSGPGRRSVICNILTDTAGHRSSAGTIIERLHSALPAAPEQAAFDLAAAGAGAPKFSGDVGGKRFRARIFQPAPIFMRRTFLCNSPDSVQFAFSQKNSSFERKAPQMRYALEPLLGDGLFISDGETWRKRRRIVRPSCMFRGSRNSRRSWSKRRRKWRPAGANPKGATVDVLVELATLTAEIICRTLFGRKLGRDYAQPDRRGLQRIPARDRTDRPALAARFAGLDAALARPARSADR